VAVFTFVGAVKSFVQRNPAMLWAAIGVSFATIIVLACCGDVSRRYPYNFIFLFIFTLAEAYLVGVLASFYSTDSVLIAIGGTVRGRARRGRGAGAARARSGCRTRAPLTPPACTARRPPHAPDRHLQVGLTLALTLFAWQTKIDFTAMGAYRGCMHAGMARAGASTATRAHSRHARASRLPLPLPSAGGALLVVLLSFIFFGLFVAIIGGNTLRLVYACIGCVA
jgi:hypothetical protein